MPLEKLAYVVPLNLLAGAKFPNPDDDATLTEITATRKFKTLITLTEAPHPAAHKLQEQFGLRRAIHIGISDFSTPTDSQIREFVSVLLEHRATVDGDDVSHHFVNCPVLIHCHLGAGRTGLMLSIGIVAFFYYFRDKLNNSTKHKKNVLDSDEIVMFVQEIGGNNKSDNLFTNVLRYHQRVRPQSIMTTKQLRWLEELLLRCDDARRRSLFCFDLFDGVCDEETAESKL